MFLSCEWKRFGIIIYCQCHVNVRCLHVADTVRALYMGDNDFEHIPPEIGRLTNLQIVSERDAIVLYL